MRICTKKAMLAYFVSTSLFPVTAMEIEEKDKETRVRMAGNHSAKVDFLQDVYDKDGRYQYDANKNFEIFRSTVKGWMQNNDKNADFLEQLSVNLNVSLLKILQDYSGSLRSIDKEYAPNALKFMAIFSNSWKALNGAEHLAEYLKDFPTEMIANNIRFADALLQQNLNFYSEGCQGDVCAFSPEIGLINPATNDDLKNSRSYQEFYGRASYNFVALRYDIGRSIMDHITNKRRSAPLNLDRDSRLSLSSVLGTEKEDSPVQEAKSTKLVNSEFFNQIQGLPINEKIQTLFTKVADLSKSFSGQENAYQKLREEIHSAIRTLEEKYRAALPTSRIKSPVMRMKNMVVSDDLKLLAALSEYLNRMNHIYHIDGNNNDRSNILTQQPEMTVCYFNFEVKPEQYASAYTEEGGLRSPEEIKGSEDYMKFYSFVNEQLDYLIGQSRAQIESPSIEARPPTPESGNLESTPIAFNSSPIMEAVTTQSIQEGNTPRPEFAIEAAKQQRTLGIAIEEGPVKPKESKIIEGHPGAVTLSPTWEEATVSLTGFQDSGGSFTASLPSPSASALSKSHNLSHWRLPSDESQNIAQKISESTSQRDVEQEIQGKYMKKRLADRCLEILEANLHKQFPERDMAKILEEARATLGNTMEDKSQLNAFMEDLNAKLSQEIGGALNPEIDLVEIHKDYEERRNKPIFLRNGEDQFYHIKDLTQAVNKLVENMETWIKDENSKESFYQNLLENVTFALSNLSFWQWGVSAKPEEYNFQYLGENPSIIQPKKGEMLLYVKDGRIYCEILGAEAMELTYLKIPDGARLPEYLEKVMVNEDGRRALYSEIAKSDYVPGKVSNNLFLIAFLREYALKIQNSFSLSPLRKFDVPEDVIKFTNYLLLKGPSWEEHSSRKRLNPYFNFNGERAFSPEKGLIMPLGTELAKNDQYLEFYRLALGHFGKLLPLSKENTRQEIIKQIRQETFFPSQAKKSPEEVKSEEQREFLGKADGGQLKEEAKLDVQPGPVAAKVVVQPIQEVVLEQQPELLVEAVDNQPKQEEDALEQQPELVAEKVDNKPVQEVAFEQHLDSLHNSQNFIHVVHDINTDPEQESTVSLKDRVEKAEPNIQNPPIPAPAIFIGNSSSSSVSGDSKALPSEKPGKGGIIRAILNKLPDTPPLGVGGLGIKNIIMRQVPDLKVQESSNKNPSKRPDKGNVNNQDPAPVNAFDCNSKEGLERAKAALKDKKVESIVLRQIKKDDLNQLWPHMDQLVKLDVEFHKAEDMLGRKPLPNVRQLTLSVKGQLSSAEINSIKALFPNVSSLIVNQGQGNSPSDNIKMTQEIARKWPSLIRVSVS